MRAVADAPLNQRHRRRGVSTWLVAPIAASRALTRPIRVLAAETQIGLLIPGARKRSQTWPAHESATQTARAHRQPCVPDPGMDYPSSQAGDANLTDGAS